MTFKGYQHTEEWKKQQSIRSKKLWETKLRERRKTDRDWARNQSASLKKWWANPRNRELQSKAHIGQVAWNKGKRGILSDETRKRIGDRTRGKTLEEILGEEKACKIRRISSLTIRRLRKEGKMNPRLFGSKNPSKRPEIKAILHEQKLGRRNPMWRIGKKHPFYGKRHSEEARRKIREKRKLQQIPTSRTKPELKFIEICEKYNLPFRYTGDGSFWIENVNPDFVECNGKKIAVEVFGDYWHSRPEKIREDELKERTLAKYGWKRIIIWQHELDSLPEETIIDKILKEI